MSSVVRLDPIEGVYDLRVYQTPTDNTKPLEEEGEYRAAGRVVISGDCATISCTAGDLDIADFLVGTKERLRELGVTRVYWKRHKNGKVKELVLEI